VILLLTLFTL